MSIQTSTSTSATISKHAAKKIYVLAFTVMSMSSMISVSAQAAGLGELFSNNTAKKSKFLPVDQAFQVSSSTKAMSKGTRLSIAVDITPGHYVYKNKLTMSFPKGVSATPFTFSQSPVSIDDPTFGKVPVFTQKNMVATTMLTTNNGKGAKNVPVVIGWQGCAKAGLCYPPEKIKTTVNIAVQ
ncbi:MULTISPECIES: protein-disulfide reductase DsbD N-terminal domain-containing protein [unclassified Psychrobacter]|uniref:protein-disulfide reductase DsbD N-terminal domain-containing protein n=1 Tax=unclassified Psychrobacter TaxID=196806 RepID=UPI00178814FB|nr:protein-disulfide reductase DsbD N-terminal domain-containing protein [Psychrobacter sp. FME13]MBE0440666.1 protein-disulfide reductase DsbD N-terminal domain-containing protein [Psychrobacter sp. FME13]